MPSMDECQWTGWVGKRPQNQESGTYAKRYFTLRRDVLFYSKKDDAKSVKGAPIQGIFVILPGSTVDTDIDDGVRVTLKNKDFIQLQLSENKHEYAKLTRELRTSQILADKIHDKYQLSTVGQWENELEILECCTYGEAFELMARRVHDGISWSGGLMDEKNFKKAASNLIDEVLHFPRPAPHTPYS